MGLIDKIVSCEELLSTMEQEAEEVLLQNASMIVKTKSKL